MTTTTKLGLEVRIEKAADLLLISYMTPKAGPALLVADRYNAILTNPGATGQLYLGVEGEYGTPGFKFARQLQGVVAISRADYDAAMAGA